jgi:hypothetical protein
MRARENSSKHQQIRTRIAQLAARIMAEEGSQDFGFAKRKAARQMGVPDTLNLPNNTEIEHELRAYQSLYQRDEQHDRLRHFRQEALRAMRLLENFNPHLTGPVLSGTAARYSNITIHLFTDNAKEVEFFLLGQGIPYQQGERRIRCAEAYRSVPTFTLNGEQAEVDIVVMPSNELRLTPHNRSDGELTERARPEQVAALLQRMAAADGSTREP